MNSGNAHWARITAGATLLAALVAVAWVALRDPPYVLHAQFANAGQLVKGGEVQIRGLKVGQIDAITLTPDGRADVKVSISRKDDVPLPRDTRVAIRAIGQAGVNNRYVDIKPGMSSDDLPSGAVLRGAQVAGIVDTDAVLDTFTPDVRRSLRAVIAHSSEMFAGSSSHRFNGMLEQLDPALQAFGGLAREASSDEAALRSVIRNGAVASQAIASRGDDLRSAVSDMAVTFGALASEQQALSDGLRDAPALLAAGGRTLDDASRTVARLRPALRDVAPMAEAATTFLRTLTPTLRRARGPVAELARQSPGLARSLRQLRTTAPTLRRALVDSGVASKDALPIMRGLRIYGTDLILGIFNGLAGLATGNSNATGGYVRLEFAQNPQTVLAGTLASSLSERPLVPGLFATNYGQGRRCPGTGAPPAADGSSPYVPDRTLCDPSQGMSADVNEP